MYKLITSSKNSDDLSIGFDRSSVRRREEITNNKNVKINFHLRFMLKDVFGFAEHQEKTTYDLGYKLTLTKNKDEAVIDKVAGIADARIKIDHIPWYVPHYIPSMSQQAIKSKQILNKTPTELRYVERSVFMKEVNNQNLWNFELGSYENMNVPIWIFTGFQQQDRQDSRDLNNDTFCRLPVVSAHYNLYVFDKRYQKNYTASQTIKVEFKFDGLVPNIVNGYALVLTNKLVSISSVGQRHFDLI